MIPKNTCKMTELERRIEIFSTGKEKCGLLFDVDGTLYRQDMLRMLMTMRLLTALARNPLMTYGKIKILSVYRNEMELLRRKNGANPEEQLANTIRKTGHPSRVIHECIDVWFKKEPLKYMERCLRKDVVKLINDKGETPMLLGVYSDYPAVDKLKELGIYHCFNTIVCSQDKDVKALKPSPKGFLVAAEKLGLKPDQVLYIGDRYDVDAVGAQNAGMQFFIVNGTSSIFPVKSCLGDVGAGNSNTGVE
jgi:FMN phosphatase YigB (HAD superfamily)